MISPMENIAKACFKLIDQLWDFQISILKAINFHDYFVKQGWPFFALFFLYGAIFPPLAMTYFIVAMFCAEKYFQKLRDLEVEEMYAEHRGITEARETDTLEKDT